MTELDLVSKLTEDEKIHGEISLSSISPDDGKYRSTSRNLEKYLTADAEWRACAFVQKVLIETRAEFGQAKQENVDEVTQALEKIDPLNMSLIEI